MQAGGECTYLLAPWAAGAGGGGAHIRSLAAANWPAVPASGDLVISARASTPTGPGLVQLTPDLGPWRHGRGRGMRGLPKEKSGKVAPGLDLAPSVRVPPGLVCIAGVRVGVQNLQI